MHIWNQQFWAFIMLLMVPVLISGVNISLRKMKRINFHSQAIYLSIGCMVVYGLAVLIMDYGLIHVIKAFTFADYAVLTLSSMLCVWNLLLRAQVLKMEEATKAAQYNYLSPVFQFFLDITIFDTEFYNL